NEWFPIEDATYLNFAAHAAIPCVALNAVQVSVAAKSRPHIVDDQSFFSVARSLRQSLATLIGASPDDIALTTGAGAGLATSACRSVQEKRNLVGSGRKSILRCHTDGRAQSGRRFYRLRRLQVFAQPLRYGLSVDETAKRGVVTSGAV